MKTTNFSTDGGTIEFTRINNDVNGNPRYVCHFYDLLTKAEKEADYSTTHKDGSITNHSAVIRLIHNMSVVDYDYNRALKRAKKIGGKKFHNKQYGGGIVFQSYNINDTVKSILELKGELNHA